VFSRDYSIVVCVYMVKSAYTHKFEMEESELRMYCQRFLGLEEVRVGDLLVEINPHRRLSPLSLARSLCQTSSGERGRHHGPQQPAARHRGTPHRAAPEGTDMHAFRPSPEDDRIPAADPTLLLLIPLRRAVQRENRPPFVLFAKKSAPQQGTRVVARGRIINNQSFVAIVYEQGAEIIAESYHALSSSKFTTRLLVPALHQWYREEYNEGNRADELNQQVRPVPCREMIEDLDRVYIAFARPSPRSRVVFRVAGAAGAAAAQAQAPPVQVGRRPTRGGLTPQPVQGVPHPSSQPHH